MLLFLDKGNVDSLSLHLNLIDKILINGGSTVWSFVLGYFILDDLVDVYLLFKKSVLCLKLVCLL